MSLTYDERKAIVTFRLEKAQKAIRHAEANIGMGFVEVSANRLYYAAYYAVSALLIANGFKAQTHSGIISLFGQHFVRTGIVSKEDGKLYAQLFSYRLKGDYEDNFDLDFDEIKPLVEPAKAFISRITNLAKLTLTQMPNGSME